MLAALILTFAIQAPGKKSDGIAYLPSGTWIATSQTIAEALIKDDTPVSRLEKLKKVVVLKKAVEVTVLEEKNGVTKVKSGQDTGYVSSLSVWVTPRAEPAPPRWKVEYDEVKDVTTATAVMSPWAIDGSGLEWRSVAFLTGKGKDPEAMTSGFVISLRSEDHRYLDYTEFISRIDANFLLGADDRFTEELIYDTDIKAGGITEMMQWLHGPPSTLIKISKAEKAVIQIGRDNHVFTRQEKWFLGEMAKFMKTPSLLLQR